MSRYSDRIRAGDVEPWVGGPGLVAGAVASAATARDELATLAADDPRREDVAAMVSAWEALADAQAITQEGTDGT